MTNQLAPVQRITVIEDNYIGYSKANLQRIFGNDKATYAFEDYNGCGYRLLRLLNGRRTHDFHIRDFKSNQMFLENSNSGGCIIQFEDLQHFLACLMSQVVYAKYDRDRSNFYSPVGNQMSNADIAEYVEYTISNIL